MGFDIGKMKQKIYLLKIIKICHNYKPQYKTDTQDYLKLIPYTKTVSIKKGQLSSPS
jgi:transposase